MSGLPTAEPRVTIVMTARERHSLAESAIASVIEETPRPYRFIYVDAASPAWLRGVLAERARDGALEVVHYDEPLWPQQARVRVADTIETEYTVFIDNDVNVSAGWLESLVACADATGAGVVGPLYLAGDGVERARIHMAGGRLIERETAAGRALEDTHVRVDEDPEDVGAELSRAPCDFVEFHCMLVRTELVHRGVLDQRIRCVHEHIDTSLTARRLGYATYFEPAARVTYLAHADYLLDELEFFRERWAAAEGETSIATFCEKWNVVDDGASFAGVRQFLIDHVAEVDPIRPSLRHAPEHRVAMNAEELPQTRSGLLDMARSRGYGHNDLARIANAYHLAQVLMDGGYRPCGRPFLNHLAGTAGVLVRYGFRSEIVAASLLHSAYSHSVPNDAAAAAAGQAVCAALGGRGSALERRVRAYTLHQLETQAPPSAVDLATFSTMEAEIVAMTAANELDMYLSGEIRYSGRTDLMAPAVREQIARVCEILDVQGLNEALRREQDNAPVVPPEFVTGMRFSYRIAQDRRTAIPMNGGQPVLP